MGKALNAIFKSTLGIVPGTIIDGKKGFIRAVTGLAAALSGPVTFGLYVFSNVLAAYQNAPKPDTSDTSIKSPRPERVAAYGRGRLFGSYALFETSSNGVAADVYAIHDGLIDGIEAYYLGDDLVTLTGTVVDAGTDNRYDDSTVNIYTTLGQTPGTAFSALIALFPGIWTSNHRGDGVVMAAVTWKPVKSEKYLEIYPNQQPSLSLVARWQLCPDPFAPDPSDESGWTWTENPVRQLMHYKLAREKISYQNKIAPTLAYWQAAAVICDAARALKAGGTEPWYRSSVAHKLTDPNGSVVSALLSTFDGWMAPRSDGALVIYAGKYYVPSVSIGPDEIIAFSWDGVGVDPDQTVNEVICSYISAEHDYNTVETDAWTDEDSIATLGQILSSNLDPQVPSWGQVRYLAKRKMARTNALYRGSVTTNVAGRSMRGQRFIYLNLTEAGATFYNGIVEITSAVRNMQTGGMTFSWVAFDPAVDSWNPATEEGNAAANGDNVAPDALTTPTIITATAQLYESGAQIAIDAVDPTGRDDVEWFTRWKVSTETAWVETPANDTDPGSPVALLTGLVLINQMIDVQVSYIIGDGRQSAWSATTAVDTDASLIAPAAPTGFSITPAAGHAVGDWTNPTSPSFAEIRFYRGTVNSFGSSTLVATLPQPLGGPGTYDNTGLAAGTYYFWITAAASGGAASAPVASGAQIVT